MKPLPKAFTNFYRDSQEKYKASRTGDFISATELISPPQLSVIRRQNQETIDTCRDARDEIAGLLGSAIHMILEHSNEDDITEERMKVSVDGFIVSGAVDVQAGREILDYKVTSTYTTSDGPKTDWIRQLNIYRWMAHEAKGLDIQELTVWTVYRDWKKSGLKSDKRYPSHAIMSHSLPVWSFAETKQYVQERLATHASAWESSLTGSDLPACSDEERWYRPPKFAAQKVNNKRASKLFDAHVEALAWVQSQKVKAGNPFAIIEREGEHVRCKDWCDAAPWCQQWRRIQNGNQRDLSL